MKSLFLICSQKLLFSDIKWLCPLWNTLYWKNHICEEGGDCLRISVWHLLMNLRYLLVYQKSSWYDLWFLRYRVWQTEIGNYGSFFPFYPFPPLLYICVPKIGTVPGIRSATERQTVCHFGLLFWLFTRKQPKKSKFLKNEKGTWRCHHFAHVYQK